MEGIHTLGGVIELLLALGALGAGLWLGPRAVKVATLKAQLKAKDDVIATNEQTIDSLTKRLEALEQDMQALKRAHSEDAERIVALERDVATWRARYEEMQRYAAPEALAAVTDQIKSVEGLVLEVRGLLTPAITQQPS